MWGFVDIVDYLNILQNSNICNRSWEILFFVLFKDKKLTQFSGFTPTLVGYLTTTVLLLFSNTFTASKTLIAFVMSPADQECVSDAIQQSNACIHDMPLL